MLYAMTRTHAKSCQASSQSHGPPLIYPKYFLWISQCMSSTTSTTREVLSKSHILQYLLTDMYKSQSCNFDKWDSVCVSTFSILDTISQKRWSLLGPLQIWSMDTQWASHTSLTHRASTPPGPPPSASQICLPPLLISADAIIRIDNNPQAPTKRGTLRQL